MKGKAVQSNVKLRVNLILLEGRKGKGRTTDRSEIINKIKGLVFLLMLVHLLVGSAYT